MRFYYKQLADFFKDPLPTPVELAEQLTRHAWEVEEIIPQGSDDWELEIKILPDRATDAKTPDGLAREINTLFPKLTPKQPWPLPDANTARQKIIFSAQNINDLLGLSLTEAEIIEFLRRVGVVTIAGDDSLLALVPSARLDLNIKEDLADEVARLYGYDLIPARLNNDQSSAVDYAETLTLANQVRAKLVQDGYSEHYGYTFVSQGEMAVVKPLASDKAYLRTSLTAGLQKVLMANLDKVLFDQDEVRMFEIGTVFVNSQEEIRVAIGRAGKKLIPMVEVTERKLVDFAKSSLPDDNLAGFIKAEVKYRPISIYPRIVRDVAIWVPVTVTPTQVAELIKVGAGAWCVEGPILFDEFIKGEQKSLAFRLSFQSLEKTLSDEEINLVMTEISQRLAVNDGWQVR